MGCQVSAGEYSINYSVGAWLVAEMCSPWFDEERDMDDPQYGQQCWIDQTSFVMADSLLPSSLEDYILWRNAMGINYYNRRELDEYDFRQARYFVKVCADYKLTASLSH